MVSKRRLRESVERLRADNNSFHIQNQRLRNQVENLNAENNKLIAEKLGMKEAAKPKSPVEQEAERMVDNCHFQRMGSVSTLCVLVLTNGYEVYGHSACANPDHFDVEIGQTAAYDHAMSKVLELAAFRLREQEQLNKTMRDLAQVAANTRQVV